MQAKIEKRNGLLKIKIDNRYFEPLSFKTFRPSDRNISDFYKSNVKLQCILSSGMTSYLGVPYSLFGESWIGNRIYDFSAVDRQIELFIKNAPDDYFALMLQLDTRDWWLIENPECSNSFFKLSQTAGCEKWREAAADYMQAMIKHVEDKYGERFYGYFLLGGMTTEWFSYDDFGEGHPYKEAAYRKYTGDSTIAIPEESIREHTSKGVFRDPKQDADAVRYWKFHHELIADTILYFAEKAQEVLKHRKLLGLYFGYLLELSEDRLLNVGHLAYEKVFASDNIDMIASPSSYHHRKFDQTSAFMTTVDSLRLHNKIYFLEFDHITHLAPPSVEGRNIPGYTSKLKNEEETISVMRRDYMMCLAKGVALWWFDMFEGWFYSDGMMKEIKNMVKISEYMSEFDVKQNAEIAVFAHGESMYYIDKKSGLNTALLDRQREGLNRMGAPYDIFSLCDMDKIDLDKYKMVIFLNTFTFTDGQRTVINEKVKSGNKSVVWVYAPDYIQVGGLSLKAVSEMTGIMLTDINRTDNTVVTEKGEYGTERPVSPCFAANDPMCSVLGTYKNGGEAAFVSKDCGRYVSYYSGMGNIDGDSLRMIAKAAGVHIYTNDGSPVYANSRICGVYPACDGEITVHFEKDGMVKELFENECFEIKNKKLALQVKKGEAKLFLLY